MIEQMNERCARMTVEHFKARYNFVLTPEQQAQVDRAEGLGQDLLVVIGYACGMRYLLNVEGIEE